jgi:precorrin-6B methylase 2
MKSSVFVGRNVLLLSGMLAGVTICAQEKQTGTGYEPKIGQKGKDVVWVPTPQELVDKMLELAQVKPGDFVIDLGSGDGRTVISAAKLGARAEGIEFNHDMVVLSKENAGREGVSDKVTFKEGDLFNADLSEATVITLFLLPEINLRLRPRLLDLQPGTRVVSNTFTMSGWTADSSVTTQENWNSWNTAFLWIVPANAAGLWKSGNSLISLSQEFQMISGICTTGDKTYTVLEGRLRGTRITFVINDNRYSAVVDGDAMKGTVLKMKEGTMADFLATREVSNP